MSTTPKRKPAKLTKPESALIAQLRQIVHPTPTFKRRVVQYLKNQLEWEQIRERARSYGAIP